MPIPRLSILEGIRPVRDETTEWGWGVNAPGDCGHGTCGEDGAPSRQRTLEYVFRGPYAEVVARVESDLKPLRLERVQESSGRKWEDAKGLTIYVSPGRYNPYTGDTDDDSNWVRVTVMLLKDEGRVGQAYRWLRAWGRPIGGKGWKP